MFDDDFNQRYTFIHTLDPRFKIVVLMLFSTATALSNRWSALGMGLLFAVILCLLARLPVRKVLKRMILVNGLVFFLWLVLPFTVHGEALFRFGYLNPTREGVAWASLLTLRSNVIFLGFISLVATTPVYALGRAMGKLGAPGKVVQLFFFTYRYVHVMHQEYQRLIRALKVRGFRNRTSLHTYRTYAYLVGMLMVRSYERSERLRKAMICRGFNGTFYDLSEFTVTPRDVCLFGSMLLPVAGIVLLQWRGVGG